MYKLTYAGNLKTLEALRDAPRHLFVQGDICASAQMAALLAENKPRAIVHFAAESDVDRSIHRPGAFMNSPHSASKAASDHLVRAYHHAYGMPTLTTNCSNNYGPFHFPEKLILLIITNAGAGKPVPIYGDGQQVRDWLYVGDHCGAIRRVLEAGRPDEVYNVGGRNEMNNLDVVHALCDMLDPRPLSYRAQITYVQDRPGHDRRYAIDASKIERELGWTPAETFETGIKKTVAWYLANEEWMRDIQSGDYLNWIEKNYSRLTQPGAPA